MSASNIDIRQLRYFVAVVRNGSFRAAAQAVHISQPPLTRQIQQLEEAIGVELLIRRSRGVETTPAGAAFFVDAQNILDLIDRAAQRAKLTGEGQMGRLDVGVFGSAVLDTVPKIIKDFRELYPKVEVVLHNMDRESQIEALRERRIAVGLNRFFEDEPGLTWEPLHNEAMMVAVPAAHPLADKAAIRFSDIANEPFIFYPRVEKPGGFTAFTIRMLNERGIQPNVVQNVDNAITAIAMVSSGLGICFVVEGAQNLRLPGVRYLTFEEEQKVRFDLCMIWREDDDTPLTEAFLQVARDCDKTTLPAEIR